MLCRARQEPLTRGKDPPPDRMSDITLRFKGRADSDSIITDSDRVDWCLKHCYGKQLGAGSDDWDYTAIKTRAQIDRQIMRERKGA